MTQTDKATLTDRLSNIGIVTPTLAEGQGELIDTGRDIPELIEYIGQQLRVGGEATINAGMGLIEAKRKLKHGEWGTWLAEHFGLSARQAQRLMVIARNYGPNTTLASHLGQTKALALLALPESEREKFLSETHQVNGEEKTVIDMTSRELEKAIKERDEAREAEYQAKVDTKSAQEARRSMEESLNEANSLLTLSKLREAELEKQLAELKAAPVDVAVMEVDQAQLDAARAEGEAAKAEEVAQLQAKLDKAKASSEKADEKRKEAEAAMDILKLQLEEASKTKAKTAAMSDPEVARFEVYFNQVKETVNKMRGLLLKARGREDQAAAERLTNAILALSEAVKGAAQ